jgi:hypothetical protein
MINLIFKTDLRYKIGWFIHFIVIKVDFVAKIISANLLIIFDFTILIIRFVKFIMDFIGAGVTKEYY